MGCLLILATSVIGLLFMVGVGRAATYNFYFNNLEQGDNSTANPQLSVTQKGKKKKVKSSEKGENFVKNADGLKDELPKKTVEKTTIEKETIVSDVEATTADSVAVENAVSPSLRVPQADTVSQTPIETNDEDDAESDE